MSEQPTPQHRPPDVVCGGECMVMFVPERAGVGAPALASHAPTVAGAESNVAGFVASLGLSSEWVSRLGSDRFGEFVLAELSSLGVAVGHVERDRDRNTGVAFKELNGHTRVHYYRQGSAASAMDEATAETITRLGGSILHLSGVTAALSDSCERFVRLLLQQRVNGRLTAFDVNWRPQLWRDRDPSVLLELARAADIVFVGTDEAAALWSTESPVEVRALLPDAPVLVVKQGEAGATAFASTEEVFVSALAVDVVEPVGAGDAFAAGFLAGTVRGDDLQRRMRLGSILASAALRVSSDIGPVPSAPEIDWLLSLSEAEWRRANLDPVRATGG